MEATQLAQFVVLLVLVLITLVFLLFINPRKKVKLQKTQVATNDGIKKEICTTVNCILLVMKNKKSTKEELEEAIGYLLKYHKDIPSKLGIRANPEFEYYKEIFFYLCKHKNATTKLILELDKELSSANPSYKKEINESIARGLEARRV